jgi:acyl-CoA oxidase
VPPGVSSGRPASRRCRSSTTRPTSAGSLPRLATVYALDAAQKELRKAFLGRSEEDARQVEALAAGLKAYASRFNVETLQECREACGGQGYLVANRLSVLKDDTDVFTTFEGDNTVLLQLVARSRLTDFRDRFGESRFVNVLKYLSEQAATAVSELNPIVTRRTDEDHLRGFDLHRAAFRYREDHVLAGVASELRGRIQDGTDSFLAALEVQEELLRLARAHVERQVLEAFLERIEHCREPGLREVLEPLARLFALSRIEADAAWFLTHGYLEPPKAKAVREQVDALCREIRPHAVPLVDAFGIPDACLGAPIAFGLGGDRDPGLRS